MPGLPFLVVYGPWIWPAAGLVVVLLLFRITLAFRRSGERTRVDAVLAKHTAAATAPVLARAEGTVTLVGTLHGGSLATMTSTGELHAATGEVWFEYQGAHVELAATARVVLGTRVDVGHRPPAVTPRAIRERLTTRTMLGSQYRLASIQDGNTVIVTGVLTGQSSGVDRVGVRKWTLAGVPETDTIDVVALAPAIVPEPMRWRSRLALALVFAGLAFGGEVAAGKLLVTRAADWAAADAKLDGTIGRFDDLAIAAALPLSRADALAELDRQLAERYVQTPAVQAQREALARLR